MSDMDEVIKEFLVESYENLEQVDLDLLALEVTPDDRETLARIFRTIHTIKGTCGFLDFTKLEKVAHVGENLLDLLRDGSISLTPEIATALLDMVAAVRAILAHIEEDSTEGDTDYSELIARLEQLQKGDPTASELPESGTAEEAQELRAIQASLEEPTPAEPTAEPGASEAASPGAGPQIDLEQESVAQTLPGSQSEKKPQPAPASPEPSTPATAPAAASPTQSASRPDGESKSVADSTIRVDVALLDKLMNLVGELVLARNQILQYTSDNEASGLSSTSQRLNLITTELQELFMKTRMQPISTIWNKYPRVVRDLARTCGKKVRVEMEGKDTECDKTLIEAIKDPLTHLIRNSVDHGIEAPEVRAGRGKPEEGVLMLRAYHEGGSVNIEIFDDGGGLNLEKIKSKAIERGVITTEAAESMSDRAAGHLIFRPGFSTADQVSNVSGRGVGMDVVKTNIEGIGGKIDLNSTYGEGTQIRIKIPLTLAIVPALTVTSGGERFAIPQLSLVELVRIKPDEIENISGASVYRLRGKLLPMVFLNEALSLTPAEAEPETLNVVVLQADSKQFGLVVDDVNDTQEIVVKPVGTHLQDLHLYAGATIMGDGRVALILDVLGIAQRAHVISEVRESVEETEADPGHADANRSILLLFRSPDDGRMAVPISKIARLEEFKRESIELTGSREVIQYRGAILPLIRLAEALPERRGAFGSDAEPSEMLQVLVYKHGEQSVGLVVEEIMDIVETEIAITGHTSRPGVLGTTVIQDRVTELIDLEGVIRKADPYFFEESKQLEEAVF